jgi:hypothetical protein
MRTFLAFIFLFSLKVFACGEKAKEFLPFSVEILEKTNPNQKLKIYEILSPIQKGDTFLSSVTANLDGEFELDLDIREDFSYIGEYYRSYLSVASKHVDKIEIIMSYNTTKKDRSDIIFCAHWKVFKLTELLSFESAEEAPPPPPPPPPRAPSER